MPLFLIFGGWVVMVPPGVPVDRIAVVVDKEVITTSELLIEARIALAKRQGEQAAVQSLPGDGIAVFRDYVINQLLIASQARKLGSSEIPDEEVDAELARFVKTFRSDTSYRAYLRRFDIREENIRQILRRDLRNDGFIQQRFAARLATLSDDEKMKGFETSLKSWLDDLRKQADVRIFEDGRP